eukprot:2884082-Pyramimonas_sp.AAC.1
MGNPRECFGPACDQQKVCGPRSRRPAGPSTSQGDAGQGGNSQGKAAFVSRVPRVPSLVAVGKGEGDELVEVHGER